MSRFWRRALLISLAAIALVAALAVWLLYTPAPQAPRLSGTLVHGTLRFGGRLRTYRIYVSGHLPKNAPLVMVLHGSGETGANARAETGYGFDRLADTEGFAVAYPDGFEGYWNGCNIVGDYSANRLNIDDVGFLSALADALAARYGLDPHRAFAAGVSRGGHMAFRLALEAPRRFRAVAAVSANLPAPENFKCRPRLPVASILILNGTSDPLNPYDGGEVTLFGFIARGTVLSSRETAHYFGRLGAPDVSLVTVAGGGHGMPQPWWRHQRILGPSPSAPNGPAMIWNFFARQGQHPL